MKTLLLLPVAWVLGCASEPPAAPPAPAPKAPAPEVSWVNPKLPAGPGLTHHVHASKALGRDVGYVVWKPAGYDASKRYPVIYFLHGMGGNESADAGGFSGLLAGAIARGELPPVLAVFPNGGRSGYRGEVETMIVEELIPKIDRELNTLPERRGRAVAGFSMGGAGSVRLSLSHPELFCGAASWGGGYGGRGQAPSYEVVDRNGPALKEKGFAFHLVNGDQDGPAAFKGLKERLDPLGIPAEIVVLPQTGHNLGLYYQKAGPATAAFLAACLRRP